jgi:hypothetical protein
MPQYGLDRPSYYTGTMDYGPYGNYGTIRYPGADTGGGGMPPAVIGGAIAAAGALGSAYLQSRASGRATAASERTTGRALDFQEAQAAKGEEAYRAQWDYWRATREALMRELGIDITPPGMGGAGVAAPGIGGPVASPGFMAPPSRPGAGTPPNLEGATLGDIAQPRAPGRWNDWSAMGLRGARA